MNRPAQLRVVVNADLTLNAGTVEEIQYANGPHLLVHPPATTMFHQIFAYLHPRVRESR